MGVRPGIPSLYLNMTRIEKWAYNKTMTHHLIDLLEQKRQGQAHTQAQMAFLVACIVSGEIPDYQLSAWLMAVCCKGLTLDETAWLTDLYAQSGQMLDFSGMDGVVVDKHSTGGVGDKTTLILAPMMAACGLKVAKLSGRGLGFTGGTADKVEAIPGFCITPPVDLFMAQVAKLGIALGSQTADLAPADAKTYALRDVTATVASIPLIAASVMSKKIAVGADVIVLDVKYGNGAFMKTREDAQALAHMCAQVGARLGRKVSTVVSSMVQPLGHAIGHTTEIIETLETLKNQGPADLTKLCCTLGAMALVDAGMAPDLATGEAHMRETLTSGRALETFTQLVLAQGGDVRVIDDYTLMPQPQHQIPVLAQQSGFITQCDALALAKAAKALGGGRETKGAPIDLAVGVIVHAKVGDKISAGDPLVTLWANDLGVDEATQLVYSAYTVSDTPTKAPSLIDSLNLSKALGE